MLYKVTIIKYFTVEVVAENDCEAVDAAIAEYKADAYAGLYDEVEYEVVES